MRAPILCGLTALAAPFLLEPGGDAGTSVAVDFLVEWPRERAPEASRPFRFELDPAVGFAPLRLVHPSPRTPERGNELRAELWNGDAVLGARSLDATTREELGILVGGDAALPLLVPIDALVSLVFPARAASASAESLEAPPEGDRLYRAAGTGVDMLDGTFDGFADGGVSFESRLGRRTYPFDEVVALFVEPLDPPELSRGKPGAVAIDLCDGSRLHGVLERFDGSAARVRLPWDARLALPCDGIALISADDDRLTYLSDAVAGAEYSGGSAFGDDLGMVFRPAVDRAVHGAVLAAGGRTWSRGIGLQAPAALAFALDGQGWKRLRGVVAIDDSTTTLGHRGAAIFVVRGDGRELWRSDVVRGGRPPLALPELDISAVARLELAVEMGPDLDLGDRANWLDVRLER